jgi:hypothetical protein
MSEKDPNDIITDAIMSNIAKIHTALPGKFESFDGKFASVKPLIKKKYVDGVIEALPVISGVPVVFPSTGEFQLSFPIKKGDGCLIIFSERDISNWVAKGTDSEPAEPSKYDLSDAIAIPGLFSPAITTLEYDEENVVMKFIDILLTMKNNGEFTIVNKEGTFKGGKDGKFAIGNSSAELLDVLSELLNTLKTEVAGPYPLAGQSVYTALALKVDTFLKGTI